MDVAHSNNSSAELKVRMPYGGKYEISSTQWSSLNNANIIAVAVSCNEQSTVLVSNFLAGT